MKCTVDVEGLEAVLEMLTAYGDEMIPSAASGLAKGLAAVEADAKKLLTAQHAVDTGELRSSIRSQVMRVSGKEIVGDVFSGKEYAAYVEMGTGQVGKASGGNGSGKAVQYRTGGWFVPLKRGIVMMADTIIQDESNGFWTYGQPARPFLYPAFKANRKKIVAAIRAAIRKG